MMKKVSHYFLFILFLFFLSNSLILSQVKIKKGIKFGVELLNSFSTKTESFQNSLGYTFGVFTAIKLSTSQTSAILLRVEVNNTKLQYFNAENKFFRITGPNDPNWNGLNYAVFDEKFTHNVFELGLIPEYYLILNERTSLDLFVGPSIGIGTRNVETKQLDKNQLTDYPYDDYNAGFILPFSLNIGASLYFQKIVLELRFRNTIFLNGGGGKSNLNNLYAQIGLAF